MTKSPHIRLYHVREWVANPSCLHSPIDFRRLEPRRLMRMNARAADPQPSHTLAQEIVKGDTGNTIVLLELRHMKAVVLRGRL